jgi:hypothetical protein
MAIIQQGGTMVLSMKAPVLDLGQGDVVTLVDAEGTRIAARTGRVWITQEGDRRDHIVGPGETLVVARPGRTVVQALQSARIALRDRVAAANDPV